MAPAGTLWTVPVQHSGKVIKATAALGGVTIEIPTSYEHFVDNKKPEFLAKFPHGKIPAWEGADGFKLFEGIVIARYVATLAPNAGLLGHTSEEAALVDQWIHLVESEVDNYTTLIRGLCSSVIPYNKPSHNLFLERQLRAVNTLEQHLSTRTFFVGERITLADLYIATMIQRAVTTTLDAAARTKLPNLIRHLETIVNQPTLKEIYGPIEYAEKAIQFTPPKKEKEAKPAAAPAPKAEKKPKAKEVDDDDDEPSVPEEPKAKNPLDDLPKSTFNLEDWKRAYSNKETRGAGGAIEWFYQNYDPAGFSVWRVDFKYNEELTQTFMSSNQIGGFFNRLEASRKYLFGSVGVLGESGNSVIAGTLILRGTEAEPVVNVAPDWESYTYTKLDLANEKDKAFFEAALAWDLEIDGKKWADGKNFK
ncbi:elongation factor 1-gamma [Crucibulum laeve]|uniref:Elongation factor 1-gamma n=1 Tax=Crucibulum laeve TaxID=68775 RepID=A0A5C3LT75_9AGAR|nr:elongation factor 1-gamma [Crucibulum laeve]